MVDLHIHTNCSDGALEPIEILKKAESLNLKCISITDHDTCQAYNIINTQEISKMFSGKIITGCELRTSYDDIPIEILGYNVNTGIINQWRKKCYSEENVLKMKNKNLEVLKMNCDRIGIQFDKSIVVKSVKQSFAQELFDDIKKYEENKSIFNIVEWFTLDVFLRQYCSNPNSQFFVDRTNDYPNLNEIICIIKEAGGLSFLAHPMVYGFENKMDFVDTIIRKYKIDGIECYYSTFTKNETQQLLDYCMQNKLLVSGGSDFHGTSSKAEIKLGIGKGYLKVPFEKIKPWASI